jgi:hypothetical protein
MRMRELDCVWLSKLCMMRFEKSEKIRNKLSEMLNGKGYLLVDTINFEDMQAMLVEYITGGQVLVFRATEGNIPDWVRNLKFWLTDSEIGRCHAGYYKVLRDAREELTKCITDKNVLCTGWSQGAGLAIIFSKMLRSSRYNSDFLAVAPPRISDNKDFNNNGYYIINSSDIVPRLPLRLIGYRHTGKLLYFNRNAKFSFEPWRVKRILDFAADRINISLENKLSINVSDFYKDHYICNIEKVFNKHKRTIEKIIEG